MGILEVACGLALGLGTKKRRNFDVDLQITSRPIYSQSVSQSVRYKAHCKK